MTALQNNDQYIGQLLVRDGIISNEELEKGLEEQKKRNGFLCSTLVQLGLASEEKIFSILSLQIGVPYLSLKDFKIDPTALGRFPGNFALACNCLVIKKVADTYYVAMSDPMNSRAVNEIKAYLGVEKVKIFLAGDSDIRETIKKFYGV